MFGTEYYRDYYFEKTLIESENSLFSFIKHSLPMIMMIDALRNLIFYICYYFDQYICLSSVDITTKWLHILRILKDLLALFLFPTETVAIFKMKFGGYIPKVPKNHLAELALTLNDLDFCYAILNKVSRSFSVVIEQLPESLKDCVCIFYLVLRGLDTVEDDMTYPHEKKILLLRNFHKKLLIDNWSISGVGDTKDYQILLNNFNKVINVFKSLDIKYQKIIINITHRIGNGMADYVGSNGSIETIRSYNLYCHYVAGLVGYGLSSIFSYSGLEDADLHVHEQFSNSMGLFLQKTNIIRDYLEDLQAGRTWWPKHIWRNYASNIDDFMNNPNDERSIECLNHMVMDSLNHLPDVINYLHRLKHPKIFQFCAIPQVMAIATLAELYNNPLVFTSVVKIRKGLSCKLMLNSSNIYQIHQWFYFFIKKIEEKIPNRNNTNNKDMHHLVEQIKNLCH